MKTLTSYTQRKRMNMKRKKNVVEEMAAPGDNSNRIIDYIVYIDVE
jgi:hypothetical protein